MLAQYDQSTRRFSGCDPPWAHQWTRCQPLDEQVASEVGAGDPFGHSGDAHARPRGIHHSLRQRKLLDSKAPDSVKAYALAKAESRLN
jgi:hypothetical protein